MNENIISDPLAKHTITVYGHTFSFDVPDVPDDQHNQTFETIRQAVNKLRFSKSYNLRQRAVLAQLFQFAFLMNKNDDAKQIIESEHLTLPDKEMKLIKLLDEKSYNNFADSHPTLMKQIGNMK